MLERLRDRARIAFSRSQSGLVPLLSAESGFPDETAIIRGRVGVVTRSSKTSPVVSNVRAYDVHGDVNTGTGDVVQGQSLGRCDPNNIPPHPPQHQQYIEGTNDPNGSIGHGDVEMLPLSPPHLGIGQMYGDPHSQQFHHTTVRMSYRVC